MDALRTIHMHRSFEPLAECRVEPARIRLRNAGSDPVRRENIRVTAMDDGTASGVTLTHSGSGVKAGRGARRADYYMVDHHMVDHHMVGHHMVDHRLHVAPVSTQAEDARGHERAAEGGTRTAAGFRRAGRRARPRVVQRAASKPRALSALDPL